MDRSFLKPQWRSTAAPTAAAAAATTTTTSTNGFAATPTNGTSSSSSATSSPTSSKFPLWGVGGGSGGGSSSGAGGGGFMSRLVQTVQTTVANKQEEMRIAKEAKEVGKVWNAEEKQWVFYFMDQEREQIEQMLNELGQQTSTHSTGSTGSGGGGGGKTSGGAGRAEKAVADREYYDLLDVSTDADDATIRKAYFKAARKCHPDKNPNDPTAHARFQQLGHAYQILSNPASRANYDKHGKPDNNNNDATEQMDAIDPFVFFNVMFGSTLVEPYIGELWIASASDTMLKDAGTMEEDNEEENADGPMDEEKLMAMTEEERDAYFAKRDEIFQKRMQLFREKNELKQKLRQIKCAQHLRSRVASYSPPSNSSSSNNTTNLLFEQEARNEAAQIAQGAYGCLYLTTLGFAWQCAADQYLAANGPPSFWNGVTGHVAKTRLAASALNNNLQLIGAGIKAAGAGSRAMQQAEKWQQEQLLQQQQQNGDGGGDDGAKVGGRDGATSPKNDGSSSNADGDAQKAAVSAAHERLLMETMEGSLPVFLELAWAINKRDIQTTVRAACEKLFDDASVPKEIRLERAQAVRILGKTFLSVGKTFAKDSKISKNKNSQHLDVHDIKARVAVATMATMAKAQGQEVTEEDQEAMIQQAKQMSLQEKYMNGNGGGGAAYYDDGDLEDAEDVDLQHNPSSSSSRKGKTKIEDPLERVEL